MRKTMRHGRRGRHNEKVKRRQIACDQGSARIIFPLLTLISFHTHKTLCRVFPPSCSLHLTICCDWIVLLCCTSLLQWPRLSNCTSISAEMKKLKWTKGLFLHRYIFSRPGMEWVYLRQLAENVITLYEEKKKKVANFSPRVMSKSGWG